MLHYGLISGIQSMDVKKYKSPLVLDRGLFENGFYFV